MLPISLNELSDGSGAANVQGRKKLELTEIRINGRDKKQRAGSTTLTHTLKIIDANEYARAATNLMLSIKVNILDGANYKLGVSQKIEK